MFKACSQWGAVGWGYRRKNLFCLGSSFQRLRHRIQNVPGKGTRSVGTCMGNEQGEKKCYFPLNFFKHWLVLPQARGVMSLSLSAFLSDYVVPRIQSTVGEHCDEELASLLAPPPNSNQEPLSGQTMLPATHEWQASLRESLEVWGSKTECSRIWKTRRRALLSP